ncbi:MAG: alpha/beta hydrolase [Phenylobacterium sp.]|uniref:alpha/beta hydrolase n=1 Tax=Phenylobacterium sp. TaxID=1871053 RepID=UPI002737737C|nr:alpha/beta hydrolase [Phenylobacterium sp.]MDP3746470.1 alpha/beta hydrolase [Phenylobacterium sp.]
MSSLIAVWAITVPGPVLSAPGPTPAAIHKDVVYTSPGGHDLSLDVYVSPQASERPTPVLVYFHGGAWWKGARPENWKGFSSYLSAGFSVVTVGYRLAGVARAPAAVQDARCALDWVGENAEIYGFDPDRIVLMGTSAGGHLALMAGMLTEDDQLDPPGCSGPPRPAAILNYYGPADLDIRTPAGARHPSVARWIGDGPGAAALQRKLSPKNHVRAGLPPIFIVHGDADPVVPVEGSIRFKKSLDAAKAPSALYVVSGGGHGRFQPDHQQEVERRVLAFLRSHMVLTEPEAPGS